MKQTLFLGVATVLTAIGSFLATIQHFYIAYALFGIAIAMVVVAVWVTYRIDYRRKKGREELGRVLVELSRCELGAYDFSNVIQLAADMERIKRRVGEIAEQYFDSSIESRFLAVNVLDVHLDDATKQYFLLSSHGDFWGPYQQIKGWRMFLNDFLRERSD
jgi:hypothetical protein